VQVSGEDGAHVTAGDHIGEPGLLAQLDRDREVEHARDRRMVHREDRAVNGGASQFVGQPGELGVLQLAVVLARNARIEHDDAEPVRPDHLIHWCVVANPAQEFDAERGPIVMVAHAPHDPRPEPLGDRLGKRREFGVGGGLALIGQISGEDDRLGTSPGALEGFEHLAELRDAVDAVVQTTLPRQEVGVADVNEDVIGPRVFGLSPVHAAMQADRGASARRHSAGRLRITADASGCVRAIRL
jgi:hypothetical protein